MDGAEDSARTKDDDCDVDRAQYAQFIGFFEETILALEGSVSDKFRKPIQRPETLAQSSDWQSNKMHDDVQVIYEQILTFKNVTDRLRSCWGIVSNDTSDRTKCVPG